MSSGPDGDSILRSVQAGTPLPAPVADAYRPAFSASIYADQVKTWMGNVGNTNVERSSVEIDFDKGSKVDETSFNHTSARGGVDFSYAPWLASMLARIMRTHPGLAQMISRRRSSQCRGTRTWSR
jgi:hypothetical protein